MRACRWSLCSVSLGVTALVALAACTSDSNGATPSTPVGTAATSTTESAADDGILEIGAVLPSGGAMADMGLSMRTALRMAEDEINEAGGVNGRPISVTFRDEGDSTATALAAVQDLVHSRTDVVIGPTSSLNLLATLSTTVSQNVLTCAPTASALSLDDYPARGMLVRTVPSDSLQADAIARTVDESGGTNVVVASLDDAYGRPLAAAVNAALHARGSSVKGVFQFATGSTPDPSTVSTIAALQPDVVVVVADAVTGPSILTAIADGSGTRLPTFVVNDAMRRPDATTTPYSKTVAEQILGVSPLAYTDDAVFNEGLHKVNPKASGLYAVNAYDCLNLVALAANASGSDDARVISAAIPAVSTGGTSCSSFADCARITDQGRNPNYDGPNGAMAIDSSGTSISAKFEKFRIDPATGRDVRRSVLSIGNS